MSYFVSQHASHRSKSKGGFGTLRRVASRLSTDSDNRLVGSKNWMARQIAVGEASQRRIEDASRSRRDGSDEEHAALPALKMVTLDVVVCKGDVGCGAWKRRGGGHGAVGPSSTPGVESLLRCCAMRSHRAGAAWGVWCISAFRRLLL